jgi:ribosomal protein S18 acetylase RimI-like enzyme
MNKKHLKNIMERIYYRTVQSGEEKYVCALIRTVFDKLVAPDFNDEGIKEFYRFANPVSMEERSALGSFVFLALRYEKIVGMIEFIPPDRIALLFVDYRGHGIARELLARAIIKVQEEQPNVSFISVHSSPYAVIAYERLGFVVTGEKTTEHGITYIPMKLRVSH